MSTPPPRTWPCLRTERKGEQTRVILDVSVSPNAKNRDRRLARWCSEDPPVSPPVDGAANEALRKWLAKELNVPQARIELLRGASGRRKQWALDLSEPAVIAWLSSQTALEPLT